MALSLNETAMRGDIVTLELLNIGAKMHLSESIAHSLEFREYQHHALHDLVYQINAHVQAQHLGDEIHTHTEQIPATWWQHWKADHNGRIARWIKRRRPVKTKDLTFCVETNNYAAFTDSQIVHDPRLGKPRVWRFQESYVVRPEA